MQIVIFNHLIFLSLNFIGKSWNYGSYNSAHEEKFSYDANGNIKTLVRKGANITGMPLPMDNLKYFYYYTNTSNARAEYDPTVTLPANVKSLSNQLARVTDNDPAGNYADDIDNQVAGNYEYDNIGNLMKDNAEGITGIEWTVYGKIKQIKKGSVTINYSYDVTGNRISKEVIGATGGNTKQFYIRDAQGNTMAIYNGKTSYVEWSEQHLYGSSRLGIWNYGKTVPLLPVGVGYDSMMVGSYNYELTNHLGNVLSTISDKKVGVSVGGVLVDYYNAEVLNQNDYYAFGSLMPGRKYSMANTNYRYGFNGKENDNEVKGQGNQQDYGMRIYDPRLGRFLSEDPITKEYPELTPYQFASNTPIWAIDFDGLEGLVATGMPIGNSGGHGMVLSVENARKINSAGTNWARNNHQQGLRNYNIAEKARQMAIKQGRTNGDGITWWTKAMVYISPWWNSTATFSDANDAAVLMSGKNLDGSEANSVDYTAAGVGIFIPFISGSSVKNILKGFSFSNKGYKYGNKTFKNAEHFGKAVTELGGNPREKRALIETITRQVAETNGWKKNSHLSGTSLGDEVYDLGGGNFGSVDKYHGNFEIFKQKGKTYQHQGSIDIEGVKNKARNSEYDVKL